MIHDDDPLTPSQRRFLETTIGDLKRCIHARFYVDPVDPIKLNIPTYLLVVKRPMGLSTIEKKLGDEEYHSVAMVRQDFELMVSNHYSFQRSCACSYTRRVEVTGVV